MWYLLAMKKVYTLAAAALVLCYASATIGYNVKANELTPTKQTGNITAVMPTVQAPRLADVEKEVNSERVKAGLPALASNPLLAQTAQTKCNDMIARNYWSHVDPDGNRAWVLIGNTYGEYTSLGENLGYGFRTAEDQVAGWMVSPGHRANILNPNFKEEGIAICSGENYMDKGKQFVIVQHFAAR